MTATSLQVEMDIVAGMQLQVTSPVALSGYCCAVGLEPNSGDSRLVVDLIIFGCC